MSMIELECPHCGTDLEVDRGFAGGICRCSSCGTLMTVPVNPRIEAAEELHRPDSPIRPVDFPDERYDGEVDPLDELSRSATGIEIYTTDSGKMVEVPKRVPIAKKRKIARGATYAVFGLIAFLIIVGAVVISVFMIQSIRNRGDDDDVPPPVIVEDDSFEYRADRSPYELDKPNMLGVPIEGEAIVLLDSRKSDAVWYKQVRDMLKYGQSRGAGESEAFAIESVGAAGAFKDAVAKAIAAGRTQIVVILGPDSIDDDEAIEIAKRIRADSKLRFAVFVIDNESMTLTELAEKTSGIARMIRSGRLDTWVRNHEGE